MLLVLLFLCNNMIGLLGIRIKSICFHLIFALNQSECVRLNVSVCVCVSDCCYIGHTILISVMGPKLYENFNSIIVNLHYIGNMNPRGPTENSMSIWNKSIYIQLLIHVSMQKFSKCDEWMNSIAALCFLTPCRQRSKLPFHCKW